jgi:hypothetical protein
MFYLSAKTTFSVNMGKLNAPRVNVFWVNPITGDPKPVSQESNTGVKLTTPMAGKTPYLKAGRRTARR